MYLGETHVLSKELASAQPDSRQSSLCFSVSFYLFGMVKLPAFKVIETLNVLLIVTHKLCFCFALILQWFGFRAPVKPLLTVASVSWALAGLKIYFSLPVKLLFVTIELLAVARLRSVTFTNKRTKSDSLPYQR